MSIAQYRALKTTGKAKYRNARCVADGMRFDSKLERDRYLELKWLSAKGAVKWFVRQCPFHLPGGIIYRADFLVVWSHDLGPLGEPLHHVPVTVEDCKGVMTRVSHNKIRQVEEIYGIQIEIIRKVAVRSV
jgi:hypothetical protein